jgi:primosomal protein N'
VNLAPPVPSPIARIQKMYRYQMIARVPRVKMFTVPLRHVLDGLKLPRQVQIVVDVDAISLM